MTSPARSLMRVFLSVCLFLAASGLTASSQIFTTLVQFDGTNGQNPGSAMTLAQGRNGNLLGTTLIGGGDSNGTAFAMTPEGVMQYVSFGGSNGAVPAAGPLLGVDGNFYGTTAGGGANSLGTVYKISPTGTIVVLYSFDGTHGSDPQGALVQGTDGNFYGTTYVGGTSTNCTGGCGTVFKITPTGTLTTLYNFDMVHGWLPPAGLVEGSDQNFYGTTIEGGTVNTKCPFGCGTVFKITPGGQLTVLHSFTNGADGAGPEAGLVEGADGNFYGTTPNTVFKVSSSGSFTNLFTFPIGTASVESPLVQGTDGNFYGVTSKGGSSGNCSAGCGTIFQITPTGVLTTLHNFDLSDGWFPRGLTQDTNGTFYGTTSFGGSTTCSSGCGTVFSFDMGLGPFITFVRRYGRVGSGVQILGQGLTGTTSVTFNGIPATQFNVASDTFMGAIVPPGATTGPVQVTTPSGVLTSNVNLQIVP